MAMKKQVEMRTYKKNPVIIKYGEGVGKL